MSLLEVVDLRSFPSVPENIPRPETLSQTLMAKHDACPRSAFLMRKYRGGPGSHALDRGIAYHAFHEQAVNLMIEQGEPTMPGEMAREMADAIMAERHDLVLTTASQDVVRQCAWNWGEATVLDLETVIGAEVPLELEIGGFRFTCRIDLVEAYDSTLVLKDQKTSLAIRKSEEVQRGFQGQAYGLAGLQGARPDNGLTLGAGINDVRFLEEYPRYRTDDGPLVTKEAWWTRPELAEFQVSLERNIEAFERSLETGDWPARDGSHCSQCPAQRECPIPENLRALPKVETEEQAQDAFSLKLFYDREGRALQTAMRGWVQENEEPIFQGDYAFDASPTSTRVVDWEAVNAGKPLDQAVSLRTSTKFAKRKLREDEINARPN